MFFDNKLDLADELLNTLYEVEPANEEIFYSKSKYLIQKG